MALATHGRWRQQPLDEVVIALNDGSTTANCREARCTFRVMTMWERRRHRFSTSIIHPLAIEDVLYVLVDPGFPRPGLLGRTEVKKIGPLASRGQCIEGRSQCRHLIQLLPELSRDVVVRDLLEGDLQTCLLDLGGFVDVGLERAFHRDDVLKCGEPDLASTLHVLRLLDEYSIGIRQQRSLDEEDGTVVLESMDEDDVTLPERIAGCAPLQLLLQAAVEDDGPEFFQFSLPLLGLSEIEVDLGIHIPLPITNGFGCTYAAPRGAADSESIFSCLSLHIVE